MIIITGIEEHIEEHFESMIRLTNAHINNKTITIFITSDEIVIILTVLRILDIWGDICEDIWGDIWGAIEDPEEDGGGSDGKGGKSPCIYTSYTWDFNHSINIYNAILLTTQDFHLGQSIYL